MTQTREFAHHAPDTQAAMVDRLVAAEVITTVRLESSISAPWMQAAMIKAAGSRRAFPDLLGGRSWPRRIGRKATTNGASS